MSETRLDGLRVLVMEDEFLIAMDVEQLCRDHGAADVVIARNLEDLGPDPLAGAPFHAAVLDVMLGGSSTVEFAQLLADRDVPFIFATGYSDREDVFDAVAGVEVISKPYSGQSLIDAIGRAIARSERKNARSGGV